MVHTLMIQCPIMESMATVMIKGTNRICTTVMLRLPSASLIRQSRTELPPTQGRRLCRTIIATGQPTRQHLSKHHLYPSSTSCRSIFRLPNTREAGKAFHDQMLIAHMR